MAKDPRFNFYTDNWIGGTEGFTLEQEGAYLSLIIMQSKVGRFTAEQAMDKLMQKTRGAAAASAALWKFLMPKFETDGQFFWSGRMEKEIEKSRVHSEKQSERAKKRYSQNPVLPRHMPGDMPDNRTGIGNGIGSKEGGAEETNMEDYERWTDQILRQEDADFEAMFMNERIPPSEHIAEFVKDHRDLLSRYPKMRPPDQHSFRRSCIKHIKESLAKIASHGNKREKIVRPPGLVSSPNEITRTGFGKL